MDNRRKALITTPDKYRRRVPTHIGGESMTEQCHGEECRIDNVIKKYRETGVIDRINQKHPQYLDMTGSKTLHEAYNMMTQAQESFMELPSNVRKDFNNDPGLFVDFMQDPKNREKIEAYGFDASYLPEAPVRPAPTPEPVDDPVLSRPTPTPPEGNNPT